MYIYIKEKNSLTPIRLLNSSGLRLCNISKDDFVNKHIDFMTGYISYSCLLMTNVIL